MYCLETIDALATDNHNSRRGCALGWDLDLKRPRFLPSHFEWSPPDVPFYPFDNEEQQSWTRRYFKQNRACALGPYPDPARLARRRAKLEAEAKQAFEQKHGIKRPRQFRGICNQTVMSAARKGHGIATCNAAVSAARFWFLTGARPRRPDCRNGSKPVGA